MRMEKRNADGSRIAGNPRDFSACVRLLFIRIAAKDLVAAAPSASRSRHRFRLHDVAALLGHEARSDVARCRAQAWMRGHLWPAFSPYQ